MIKKRRRRRLVAVTQRIVFGTAEQIKRVLAPTGWRINTAFIERLNLTIRQHVAAIGRRVITLAKSHHGLQYQLSLFQTYYNMLRQEVAFVSCFPKGRGGNHLFHQVNLPV